MMRSVFLSMIMVVVTLCSCNSNDDILFCEYSSERDEQITLVETKSHYASNNDGTACLRLGLYETIPGYDIVDVRFRGIDVDGNELTRNWSDVCINLAGGPALFAGALVTGAGEFVAHKPCLKHDAAAPSWIESENGTTVYVAQEGSELASCDMELWIDFTLESASGETVTLRDAHLRIPAKYGDWKAGNTYTYTIKISQKVDAATGEYGTPRGLHAITFDASVVNVEEE